MKSMLLISSSTVHGSGYLDHCETQILSLLEAAGTHQVLFIPYALYDRDRYSHKAAERFSRFGVELQTVHGLDRPARAVREARAVFIGGGNTFRLLNALYETALLEPIRQIVADGAAYIGTSAGSNVACPTIRTTNDMPIVQPISLRALDLVSFQINPHFLDTDPGSRHMGETRDQRLREYLEDNATPVVAIREGAMLHVEGEAVTLLGEAGGKLYRRGREPLDCEPGSRINVLLDGQAGDHDQGST